MSVRTVFCDFCCRQADFRHMFMCPACRKTICNRCAHESPFPPNVCINKRPCPGKTPMPVPAKPTENP